MSETPTGYTSVTTDDGLTVTSSTETAEQITESLKPEPTPEPEQTEAQPKDPKLSKAASKLGKAGGEATAAKRAEAAQEAEAEGTSEEDDLAAAEQLEKEGKLGKPRHDAKARMLQKAREAKALKAEVERERSERTRLAAEIEQLRAGKAPAAAGEAKPAAKAAGPEKPKQEDYETFDLWVEAMADYQADRKLESWQQQMSRRAQEQARDQGVKQTIKSHGERFAKAAEADPTFPERTAKLMSELRPSLDLPRDANGDLLRDAQGRYVHLTPSHVICDGLINSEHGPALTLYLSDHPEEKQRLEALPDPGAIRTALARLEGRLERADAATTATAPKPEVSQARPPVRPVTGSPHTANVEPGDEASFDEHLRFHNAKERRAR